MASSDQRLAPGAYKFTVRSTEEAVTLIREKLGPSARVLSVRSVEPTGLKKFFSAPRLEVIAQVDAPATSLQAVSSESAAPTD
jgi:flagellar biosynthesis protein FlhF